MKSKTLRLSLIAAVVASCFVLSGCISHWFEDSTTRLQIENKHVSGDLESNAEMLKTYNYTPSVGLAYQTLFNAIDNVVDMGIMQNVTDKKAFVDSHFVRFDDVPDSYVYNADGTYTETTVTKLAQNL